MSTINIIKTASFIEDHFINGLKKNLGEKNGDKVPSSIVYSVTDSEIKYESYQEPLEVSPETEAPSRSVFGYISSKFWELIACSGSDIVLDSEFDVEVEVADDLESDDVYVQKKHNTVEIEYNNDESDISISLRSKETSLEEYNTISNCIDYPIVLNRKVSINMNEADENFMRDCMNVSTLEDKNSNESESLTLSDDTLHITTTSVSKEIELIIHKLYRNTNETTFDSRTLSYNPQEDTTLLDTAFQESFEPEPDPFELRTTGEKRMFLFKSSFSFFENLK